MSRERAFDRRIQPVTLGIEIRKLFQEMQEAIIHLQEMRDYARDNGKTETEKHLNQVLESFGELKKKYSSAEVMREIQKTSYLKEPVSVDKRIEKTRSALKAANKNMNEENTEAKAEMRDIRSLLKTSHSQVIYENFNDFSSSRNKFEALVEKIDNFEKIHKIKNAKNASLFFSSQPKASVPSPQTIPGAKLKSSK